MPEQQGKVVNARSSWYGMTCIADGIAICINAAFLVVVEVPIMISRGSYIPMIGSRLIVSIVVRIINQIVIIYSIFAAIVVEMYGILIIMASMAF